MGKERIAELIETLDLSPHPEGGYFKETYRSEGWIKALPPEYSAARNYSTCIYFLLTSEMFSAFHRIHQDEAWHFYEGSSIALHTISPDGQHQEHHIGMDLKKGERPQLMVPGGHWFASKVIDPDSYALVGCTVAPGFDFADFELAKRAALSKQFPQHSELIEAFSRT